MNKKKHDRVDLESKRAIFLQLGIIISSLIFLALLEWTTPVKNTTTTYRIDDIKMETDLLPVERRKELKPPVPKNCNKINIITDNNEITEDFEILSTEIVPNEPIPMTHMKLPEEQDEQVPIVWITPKMPKFPGGKIGLQQYISKHLKYPKEAISKGLQGKVFVKFLVNHKGKVEQISAVNTIHKLLDKEAIRVVKSLPLWEPGTQNGKAVNVWMTIPIVFQM